MLTVLHRLFASSAFAGMYFHLFNVKLHVLMKLNVVLMIVVIFLAALSPIQMMSMLVSILGIHVDCNL